MSRPEHEDTTFTKRGRSGGMVPEDISEASSRKLPYPPREPSEPLTDSTKHFFDKDEQQVKSRSFGSGE